MIRTLLYKYFGIGRIPDQLMSELKAEGLQLSDEAIPGSVTYLNFKAPGKRDNWRRQWFTACVVLTEVRLVGLQNGSMAVNVPFTDERFRQLQFSVEKEDRFVIAFDASLFHDDWSGRIEYRFRTPLAQSFLNNLREIPPK
jgi:hypothetical protein